MAFPKTLVRFYCDVFRTHRFGISCYWILRIFNKASDFVFPALLAKYVVGALETKPIGELAFPDVMPVLILLAAWIGIYIVSNLTEQVFECIVYPRTKQAAHVKMYQYLIDRSVAFYKCHSAGYLESQAKFIINGTWNLMFKYPTRVFAILLGIIVNFGMMFQLNGIFCALIGGVLLLRILHAARNLRPMAQTHIRVAEAASEVAGKNIDMLSNFLNLKIFGDIQREQEYVGQYFNKWTHAKEKNLWVQLKFFGLPMTMEFITLIIIMFLAAYFYIVGRMDLSQVAFVLTAFFGLRSCVVNFVWDMPDLLEVYFSADQAFRNLTHVSPEICDVKTGSRNCKYNDMIKFNNVSFKYDSEWVLQDINLCIKKGEKIGVVGMSGSGKTTLVNLLMHLYDPTCGNIQIDNTDIRKFSPRSLKRVISFVPQESILFNRSLAENISYGVGNVSRRQIINAAKQAQAHDFIMKTEHGYDTVVGDRGVKLSGGQRQRITIAHAVLKNSPILLLDEATSALDSETEMNIQQSLNHLMKNRTTIAIAHRLSTLKQMDRIIVMDQGRIVESGSHSQLLKRRGIYYKLWKMQYSGFL